MLRAVRRGGYGLAVVRRLRDMVRVAPATDGHETKVGPTDAVDEQGMASSGFFWESRG